MEYARSQDSQSSVNISLTNFIQTHKNLFAETLQGKYKEALNDNNIQGPVDENNPGDTLRSHVKKILTNIGHSCLWDQSYQDKIIGIRRTFDSFTTKLLENIMSYQYYRYYKTVPEAITARMEFPLIFVEPQLVLERIAHSIRKFVFKDIDTINSTIIIPGEHESKDLICRISFFRSVSSQHFFAFPFFPCIFGICDGLP
jgi:hypothetical protein